MKLHFEPDLDFQRDAIEAVCDLFQGQEVNRTEFTVSTPTTDGQLALGYTEDGLGYGNRLALLEDELLANLRRVQIRNGLRPSEALTSGDFTVEMETGTGKTYVYLRTILSLNERYGFTKFVVVVPSVAIKEGVFKTLQITEDHFRGLYAGQPYEYFLYDSAKLGQVRTFATSSKIHIMVTTVGAINKAERNNIYKDSEKTGGERPIDLIRATHPIVIVDEPQSVDGGIKGAGKKALEAMHPLCTLRYSATHVDKHHMVYRLDAVDAYERHLVKGIEVASATVENAHNTPHVKVLSIDKGRGRAPVSATLELDVQTKTGVRRQPVKCLDGYDLEEETGREVYQNLRIGEIRAGDGATVELRVPGDSLFLQEGEGYGTVDEDQVARQMIRRTIREHLDKELRLRPRGVKVLSLFFVPRVDLYRIYDDGGRAGKGLYAQIFEEEYARAAKHPDYQTLFEGVDLSAAAEDVHEGYFSIDKKGGFSEPSFNTRGELSNARSREDAERAYELIMKDKERLLSLDEPLKFIFSHSALREGWDNPNVFQICSLRDIRTERERRQTIGRGLRICVDQDGRRVRDRSVNTLTVVAREGYREFAEKLQQEIEADTGIRFGVVERHQFASIPVADPETGETAPLGVEASEALHAHLVAQGYLDDKGRVQDALRTALKDNAVELPEAVEPQRTQVEALLKKLAGRLEVKDADDRKTIRVRRAVLDSPEFQALWDRVKHKTTYRVEFDAEALVTTCAEKLCDAPLVPRTRLQWNKAGLVIGKGGVEATEKEGAQTVALDAADVELPDVLTQLQDRTQLTRRSIARILTESGRLGDFKRNPQRFIELAAETINRAKRAALVDGVRYRKLGEHYAQELFEETELTGYLTNSVEDTQAKSPYEWVVCDSDVERAFARDCENNDSVKVFAKLPGWFTIPTPLGSYNPDWAVVIDDNGTDRLYFVAETKGSLFDGDRRASENAKIDYGKAHFRALSDGTAEPPARYVVATDLNDLLEYADDLPGSSEIKGVGQAI